MARYNLIFALKGRPPKRDTVQELITGSIGKARVYKQSGSECTIIASISPAAVKSALLRAFKEHAKYPGGKFVGVTVELVAEEDEDDA